MDQRRSKENYYLDIADAAQKRSAEEGVTLDTNDIGDMQIIVMYAAWMWRRRDTMEGMPRMLRYALNNRVFAEKMKEEG